VRKLCPVLCLSSAVCPAPFCILMPGLLAVARQIIAESHSKHTVSSSLQPRPSRSYTRFSLARSASHRQDLDILRSEVLNPGDAEQAHAELDLGSEEVDRFDHTVGPVGRLGEQERPAQTDGRRTQAKRLEDVGPSANAA
jgi:hypothetical protein